jgi:3-hydroxyacyl-CoA dehydrogenase
MRIGILGSGLMGGKLGTIFAKAGHDVVCGQINDRAEIIGSCAHTRTSVARQRVQSGTGAPAANRRACLRCAGFQLP